MEIVAHGGLLEVVCNEKHEIVVHISIDKPNLALGTYGFNELVLTIEQARDLAYTLFRVARYASEAKAALAEKK